uniref:autocrine proliferation repressor protein A-like isoform X1 n=1 Tax=Podarcis muralis TaxID=64176 RepID=UPI00109F5798|nr:autocrine proliferation repressor protein A-like isoform X1 [Podarcis muralis]
MYAAFSVLLLAACLPSGWMQTALDDYVKQYDPHYNYTVTKKEDRPGVTVYTVNMTSLKWQNDSEVDRSIWWHTVTIAVSKNQRIKDSCLLLIGNGRNDIALDIPDLTPDDGINAATSTGSCAALVQQIPNQPITYHKYPIERCKNSLENDELFCSWWKFMNDETAGPDVLILFPMVKVTLASRRPLPLTSLEATFWAAVRAMDTVTDLLLKESGGMMNITKFSLIGASKRGWTAWLAAAVDGRVVSFTPLVFDLLNIIKNLHHQYRAYCGWSYTMEPEYELNITRQIDTTRFENLNSYVDPYAYNERYLNKFVYIIIATGDEILLPDYSRNFFSQLAAKKYFRAIPNTFHAISLRPLIRLSILDTSIAFYLATIQNLSMPQVSWNLTETETKGVIYLYTDQVPSAIKCFFADTGNSQRRDFRWSTSAGLRIIPWFPCAAEKVENGVYMAEMSKPLLGWRGFFIEVTFPGPENKPHVFTSEIHIIPDTYPCEDCQGEECYGTLV